MEVHFSQVKKELEDSPPENEGNEGEHGSYFAAALSTGQSLVADSLPSGSQNQNDPSHSVNVKQEVESSGWQEESETVTNYSVTNSENSGSYQNWPSAQREQISSIELMYAAYGHILGPENSLDQIFQKNHRKPSVVSPKKRANKKKVEYEYDSKQDRSNSVENGLSETVNSTLPNTNPTCSEVPGLSSMFQNPSTTPSRLVPPAAKRRTKTAPKKFTGVEEQNFQPSFRCQYCPEELKTPRIYVEHHSFNCRNRHIMLDKPVTCGICLRLFSSRDLFIRHFDSNCFVADISSFDDMGEDLATADLLSPHVSIHESDSTFVGSIDDNVKHEPCDSDGGDLVICTETRPEDMSDNDSGDSWESSENIDAYLDSEWAAGDGEPKPYRKRRMRGKTEGPKKELRCPLCNKAFLLEESIDIHLKSNCPEVPEESKQSGQCPRCLKQLCNEKSLLRHMQYSCPHVPIKKEGTPVSCPHCGKTFSSQFCKDVLRKHKRLCGKEVTFDQIECKLCAKKFSGAYCKDLLRRHTIRCHTSGSETKLSKYLTVKCEMCGQEYSGNYCRDVLRKHVQFSCPARGENSPQQATTTSQCEYCGKVFSGSYGKYQGQKHARFCAAQPAEQLEALKASTAECTACGKIFSGGRCKDSLRIHLKRCPRSDKRSDQPLSVKCPGCLKIFTGSGCDVILLKHIEPCSTMKDFMKYSVLDHETAQCKSCKKIFKGKSSYISITKHVKVCEGVPAPPVEELAHSSDVFMCCNESCTETFPTEDEVNEHMETCSEERMDDGQFELPLVTCNNCYLNFDSSEKLQEHFGQCKAKLELCGKCGERFTVQDLNLHKLQSKCFRDEAINYDCPKCGVKCQSEQGLRSHFRANKCKFLTNLSNLKEGIQVKNETPGIQLWGGDNVAVGHMGGGMVFVPVDIISKRDV